VRAFVITADAVTRYENQFAAGFDDLEIVQNQRLVAP
jgi:hypothetical protein